MPFSRIIAILFSGSLAAAAMSPAQGAWFAKFDGVDGSVDSLPPPPPPQLTVQPNRPNAAVSIPAFMKNARKAKTAESPRQLRLKRR